MITEHTMQSVGELVDFFFFDLSDNQYNKRMNYTFRGQKRSDYKLESSLKRNASYNSSYAELRSLTNFRKYGELLEPKVCNSIWERMVIAQHHGIPTRCLDFSFSSLVVLHFALCDNEEGMDAAVWAINHGLLHYKLLPSNYRNFLNKEHAISFTIGILEKMKITLQDYNRDMGNRSLIFLEPPSIDIRIINQFPHMEIIPNELDPLDFFLDSLPLEKAVYKFIIPEKRYLFSEVN